MQLELPKADGIINALIIILLLAGVSGCEERDITDHPAEQIAFELAVLGEDGKEAAEFSPGSDIFISLKLINNSGKPFQWEYLYDCHLFQTEDFLMVYKRNAGETTGDWMPVGRPYQSPVACLMSNMPPRELPSGENMLMKIPWSANPDNHPLSAGEYYVVARVELNAEGESHTWDLRADFEM